MSLPTPKIYNTAQLSLFSNRDMQQRIRNLGHARVLVGQFWECATAALTSAIQLKTDSRCSICPDLELQNSHNELPVYIECKSIGQHKTTTLYQERIRKDAEFISAHNFQLFYFFWRHSVDVLQHEYTDTLFNALAEKFISLIVIDFRDLYCILEKLECKHWYKEKPLAGFSNNNEQLVKDGNQMPGKKTGFGKVGYDKGWQPSVASLLELQPQTNIVLPHLCFTEPLFRNKIKIDAPNIIFVGELFNNQQINKLLPLYKNNYK